MAKKEKKDSDLLNKIITLHKQGKCDEAELLALCQRKMELERIEAERKLNDAEFVRVHRALKVLSRCNHSIVRAVDEKELMQEICNIIIGVGGYRFAWVGFAEQNEEKSVRPVAQAGYENGYLYKANITYADTERGRGPTGTAIRTGTPCVVHDISTDPKYIPWRNEAMRHGYASAVSFPLKDRELVFGALNIYAKEPHAFDEEEMSLLAELADDLAYGIVALRTKIEREIATEELKRTVGKLRKYKEGIIQAMSLTIESRDPYTAGHQRRVASLSEAISKRLGADAEQQEGIRMAALVHDLGKISVPAEILSKPGKLNDFEFSLIKLHPKIGYDILNRFDFPDIPIADIVYQHHERLDGTGYPQGLKGAEILLEARIIGVADVVEAMASHRPYRPALGIETACDEIRRNKGILYDPLIADACLEIFADRLNPFSFEDPRFREGDPQFMENVYRVN